MAVFADRREGGRALARALAAYAGRADVLVLGLPRGGVVVAAEVAEALGAPLDIVVVRKLGVPGHEELAMGAIAGGGAVVLNEEVVRRLGIGVETIAAARAEEAAELRRREALYRGDRPMPDLRGKMVILVDDGLATGSTMRAAITALRGMEPFPAKIVAAAPVGAPETCEEMKHAADGCVCAMMPEPFYGVGAWYEDFAPTNDDRVREVLEWAWARPAERT